MKQGDACLGQILEERGGYFEFTFGKTYDARLVPVRREPTQFSDRLIPPAQHDGFTMLNFFDVVGEMGFGFVYIDFLIVK